MNLSEVQQGQTVYIKKVNGKGAFRKRILEMGFVQGQSISVVKKAPLQDPIEYQILDYEVSLRINEAKLIDVVLDESKVESLPFYSTQLHSSPFLFSEKPSYKIAFVGNPNAGKTTLFNHLSNSKERVANYAGVTVGSKVAQAHINGIEFEFVDLPGTYSITEYSPEELYVREYLLHEKPDLIVNVVDATNLERNLFLTTQLMDMGLPVMVAFNMTDELEKKGLTIDYTLFTQLTGMAHIETVGNKGKGIKALKQSIYEIVQNKTNALTPIDIQYGEVLEQGINDVQNKLQHIGFDHTHKAKFHAIKALENDSFEIEHIQKHTAKNVKEFVEVEREKIAQKLTRDIESEITDVKYGTIQHWIKQIKKQSVEKSSVNFSDQLDRLLTHPILAYPIFLFVMWITFNATFYIGQYPMDWLDAGIGSLNDLLKTSLPAGFVNDLITDGIISGVGGVLVFLPNILILFFFITIMESTGYMARIAFIVDKLMNKVGLHGRSFIPLLMGFGCNVPAIMATRTIKDKNDRIATMLITPFMSCSARYPVYILIISAFFTSYQGSILFAVYLLGILLAALLAFVFKKTLLKGTKSPFIMEMPPYRFPSAKTIANQTWFKGKQYLKKMGTTILVASLLIWICTYFPQHNATTDQIDEILTEQGLTNLEVDSLEQAKSLAQLEGSIIGKIGHGAQPIFAPLGYDWKICVALITGGAAKEVIISTLGVLYEENATDTDFASLPEKLRSDTHQTGPKKGQLVFTMPVALNLMVFILIYFPCIAVFAAIGKESGKMRWATFTAVYTTVLAYALAYVTQIVSSIFYG